MNSEHFFPPRNFCNLDAADSDFQRAQVVVLPVPYDSTTSFKTGTREGPQAIIEASQEVELYDIELGCEIAQIGIHTLNDVMPALGGPEQMIKRIETVMGDLLDKGKKVAMLGGDHSITVGAVRAVHKQYPKLSVLQLDAHADLRNEWLGTGYSNASVMRRVREICPAVQVGIRSMSVDERQFVAEKNLELFYAEEALMTQDTIDRIISRLSDHVYVTVDLDVFDPSIMAAVGTPQPGGLGWYEVLRLLKSVAQKRKVISFDLVELSPHEGPTACAFLAAKLAYKFMGYVTLTSH
jgi:agmatinase